MKHTGWTRAAVGFVALSLSSVNGCQQADDTGDPEGEQSEGKTEVTSERYIKVSPERAARGKELFEQRCVTCHGPDAQGRVGTAPSLVSETFLEAASDEFLVTTIQKGRDGSTMPPWGLVSAKEDVEAIVAYLRSLTPTEPATLDESPLRGDATRGEEVFRSVCGTCHGRTGAGYQEAGSGTGIGRRAFLTNVSDGYIRYLVRHGKSGTPMRSFTKDTVASVANLNQDQIEDVIMYLRTNAW